MPTADPFQWPEGEPLFETEWRALSEALAGNGIVAPGDLEVTATATDLEIQVAAGSVWYTGSETTLGAAETHTLSSGGTDDRWDTVFFDTGTGASGVREGTASASPLPPDIQGDEILLAVVYVEGGATNVTDSEISNWRSQRPGAERIQYDDSPGVYATATVDGALDELQEAAQATAYPFALATDTDMDVAATDLVDGATVLYESANGWVRNEVVQALANLTGDEQFTAYPLAQADLASGSVGSGEVIDGSLTDADLDLPAIVVEDPERQFIARLDDTESIEIPVRVPDTQTLEVYRWGAFDASDGTAPAGLTVELLDGADTVQVSANTANNQSKSTPVASHSNSSGSASIFKVRAKNGTGAAINSPGVGMVAGFVVV